MIFKNIQFTFASKPKKLGFSLIELLVVISIFTVITAVVLFNQSRFSSNIVVTNLAYEVALAIRQAQTYGISVKASDTANTDFNSGYGIHIGFDTEHSSYNPLKTFTLFTDKSTDKFYTPTSSGNPLDPAYEYKDTFRLPGGNIIKDFRFCDVNDPTNSVHTLIPGTMTSPTGWLDIVYIRPKPDATIYVNRNSGTGNPLQVGPLDKVAIDVQSALGDKIRTVVAYSNGQISVPSTDFVLTCP